MSVVAPKVNNAARVYKGNFKGYTVAVGEALVAPNSTIFKMMFLAS